MIVVFDANGAVFNRLRGIEPGFALWRSATPRRLESRGPVKLGVVAAYDAGWRTSPALEQDFDVLVVADKYDERDAIDSVGFGLRGYLDAQGEPAALGRAIRRAMAGEPAYPLRVLDAYLRQQEACFRVHRNAVLLTPRQREVVAHIQSGDSDKEIAAALRIATATAQKHVTNILERLAVPNRAAAAAALCSLRLAVAQPSCVDCAVAPHEGRDIDPNGAHGGDRAAA